MVRLAGTFLQLAVFVSWAIATQVDPHVLDACPGYSAQNVKVQGSGLSADLVLASTACNVFGPDVSKLKLSVTYETGTLSVIACSLSLNDFSGSNSCQDHRPCEKALRGARTSFPAPKGFAASIITLCQHPVQLHDLAVLVPNLQALDERSTLRHRVASPHLRASVSSCQDKAAK